MVVGSPFEELELPDELRFQPLAFRHLRFRQPLTPTIALRLRQIRKRALIHLEPLNFLNSCARVTGVKRLRVPERPPGVTFMAFAFVDEQHRTK